jgi:hypothetical protein
VTGAQVGGQVGRQIAVGAGFPQVVVRIDDGLGRVDYILGEPGQPLGTDARMVEWLPLLWSAWHGISSLG